MKARNKKYLFIKKIVKMSKRLTGCIEFPHFGARYPDACCIDGELWDLDSGDNGFLTSTEGHPCPVCRAKDYVQGFMDDEVPLKRILDHMKFIYSRYGTPKPTPYS